MLYAKKYLFLLSSFFVCTNFCNAHVKQFIHQPQSWNSVQLIGPIASSEKWSYFFKEEARFDLHDEHVFDESVTDWAICYDALAYLRCCLGTSIVVSTKENPDEVTKEQRFWPEITWRAKQTDRYKIISRTRLEIRNNFARSGVALRFRQKVIVHFLNDSRRIHPFWYDELFINLKKPAWITRNTVDQNRFFIGVKVKHNAILSWELGYLNQIKFGDSANLMNHVGIFAINITIP